MVSEENEPIFRRFFAGKDEPVSCTMRQIRLVDRLAYSLFDVKLGSVHPANEPAELEETPKSPRIDQEGLSHGDASGADQGRSDAAGKS